MRITTGAAQQVGRQRGRILVLAAMAVFARGPEIVSAGDNVWTKLGPEGGPASALAIDPRNPGIVYAATDAGLYRSADKGSGWNAVKPGPPCCVSSLLIHPQNSSTLFAVTQVKGLSLDRRVLKSADAGATWSPANSGLPVDAKGRYGITSLAIDPRDETTLYAANAGLGGGVYKSADGGDSWNAVNSGLPDGAVIAALAIDPRNPDTIYASTGYVYPATNASGIFQTLDGGANWSAVNSGLPASVIRGFEYFSVLAIDPKNTNTVYAAANDEGLFKTTDAGGSWTGVKEMANTTVIALAIDPINSDTVYAGTSAGILRSADGGTHWSAVKTRLITDSYGLLVIPALAIDPQNPDTVYAAGTYAGILKTTDAGASWTTVNSDLRTAVPASFVLRFDPQSPGTIYAATIAGVFKTADTGANWTGMNAGLPAGFISTLAIDPQNPGTIYVMDAADSPDEGICYCYSGQIFKSTDGGANWDTALAREASGLVVKGARLYSFPGNALAIDPRNPRTIYAGGTYFTNVQKDAGNGVLKSLDGGATWVAVSSGLPVPNPASNQGNSNFVNTLAIDPQNSSTVYAGVYAQGLTPGSALFKTTNGGGNWKDIGLHGFTSVDILAIDPQNPDTVYAKAVDRIGCVPPILPVLLGQGGCGWLYKTTNGGTSWSRMSAGLPTYVTALAIDPQNPGTIYAGSGSGVFRSTDGGASWNALNTGLTSIAISSLAIDPRNPATLYAGTDGGVFAITFVAPQ